MINTDNSYSYPVSEILTVGQICSRNYKLDMLHWMSCAAHKRIAYEVEPGGDATLDRPSKFISIYHWIEFHCMTSRNCEGGSHSETQHFVGFVTFKYCCLIYEYKLYFKEFKRNAYNFKVV